MQEVVIVSAARTPIGQYMGILADQRSQDLTAASMKEAVSRSGLDSAAVDLCIYSEAKQSSLPANVGRHGWLLAGFAEETGGFTMNTLCAGAIQTMISAYNKLRSNEYSSVMTGGIETNSQAQYYLVHPRYKFGPENFCFHDSKKDVEINAQPVGMFGELSSVALADNLAKEYGFSKDALAAYSANSKAKVDQAIKNGNFADGIAPVTKMVKKEEVVLTTDESGNAVDNVAPLADASASLLLMSAEKAKESGCQILGKVLGFGVAAGDPAQTVPTAMLSIEKALKATGLSLSEIDYIDFHEPSAAFALALTDKLGSAVADKLNVDGGSLGFGHAGAATGGIMAVNMLYRLRRTGASFGLVNVTALGGQSLSLIIGK